MLVGLGVEAVPFLVADVTARTQGWAAGLRFAAMAALVHRSDREAVVRELRRQRNGGRISPCGGAQRATKSARDVLLRTSIVDVMRPGLVEELAGPQARRALAFLIQGNAFIEESTETPRCYTYHPLFRELLRAQLWYEAPELVPELHRAAARGCRPLSPGGRRAPRRGRRVGTGSELCRRRLGHRSTSRGTCAVSAPRRVRASARRCGRALRRLFARCVGHGRAGRGRLRPTCREARQLLDQAGRQADAVDLAFSVLLLARAVAKPRPWAAADAERLIRATSNGSRARTGGHGAVQEGPGVARVRRLDEAAAAFASGAQMDEWTGREYPVPDLSRSPRSFGGAERSPAQGRVARRTGRPTSGRCRHPANLVPRRPRGRPRLGAHGGVRLSPGPDDTRCARRNPSTTTHCQKRC
jgi:hypothetical protein